MLCKNKNRLQLFANPFQPKFRDIFNVQTNKPFFVNINILNACNTFYKSWDTSMCNHVTSPFLVTTLSECLGREGIYSQRFDSEILYHFFLIYYSSSIGQGLCYCILCIIMCHTQVWTANQAGH